MKNFGVAIQEHSLCLTQEELIKRANISLRMALESIHGDDHNTKNREKSRHKNKRNESGPQVGGNHKYSINDLDKFLDIESKVVKPHTNDKSKKVEQKIENPQGGSIEDAVMEEVGEMEEPAQNITDDDDVEMILDTVDNSFQPGFAVYNSAISTDINSGSRTDNVSKVTTLFVVDTNFIILHLDILEDLRSLFSTYHHTIMIPRYTIRELDGLKNENGSKEKNCLGLKKTRQIGEAARKGNAWIYSNLANMDSGVMGQKLTQRMDINVVKDDAILDCCIYFKERQNCFVILLSNDKNLCLKALTDDILTVSYRRGMTGELIAKTAFEENAFRYGTINGSEEGMFRGTTSKYQDNVDMMQTKYSLDEAASKIFHEIVFAVLDSITHIMLDEYGDSIDCLDFDPTKLKDLTDASKCVFKYWISVFSEYFRGGKLQKDSWKLLPAQLTTIPQDISSLTIFQQFWSEILEHFFVKRTPEEQDRLQLCIQQWENCIKNVI
ncbi:hypothetical protein C6P45_001295 [Maudiozyma exigua]|uniref:Transcriptional protein SWT1 n=1 Tax=Maudiozyma exigua TaxID=34358 RepID=A0A9P6W240_MAUEX|nr:hypothetical protein C6P45_001295 [Kazachstania exigua]